MTTETSTARDLATVREYASNGAARAIREAADLRLADVARELDVSVATVSGWERGWQRPTGDRALAYLALLRELAKPTDPLRRAPASSLRRAYAR
jgi:DNA-binding transcriptional regulator YiaG